MAKKSGKVEKKRSVKTKKINTGEVGKTESFADAVDKKYGKGSMVRLGDIDDEIKSISTGILSLDAITGADGIPLGRIIQIYGPESSGKTTLALHICAAADKANMDVAIIDAECSLKAKYAKRLGISSRVFISKPQTGEKAIGIIDSLLKKGFSGVIVLDSVARLTPAAEENGDVGDSHMGLLARLMGQGLRKILWHVSQSDSVIIFINQNRVNIGSLFYSENRTGGKALQYFISLDFEVKRIGKYQIGAEGAELGNKVKISVKKNKVGAPNKSTILDLVFNEGFSRLNDIVDISVEAGYIEQAGSWYSYGDERIGQGRQNTLEYIENNPEILKSLEARVKEYLGTKDFKTRGSNEEV